MAQLCLATRENLSILEITKKDDTNDVSKTVLMPKIPKTHTIFFRQFSEHMISWINVKFSMEMYGICVRVTSVLIFFELLSGLNGGGGGSESEKGVKRTISRQSFDPPEAQLNTFN